MAQVTGDPRTGELTFHDTIWDKAELSTGKKIFTIISLILIALYVFYVHIIGIEQYQTSDFFSKLGIDDNYAEFFALIGHYFVPVVLPLIWGFIEYNEFEILRSRFNLFGTAEIVFVFWMFKIIFGLIFIYFIGIVTVPVNTIRLIISFFNDKYTEKRMYEVGQAMNEYKEYFSEDEKEEENISSSDLKI